MIEIVSNGTPYIDFVDVSVNVSLDSLSNDFTFTASSVKGFPDLKQNDEIQINVDGVRILTGFIDEVNGSEQEGNHLVTYSGRDKTSDLIDSQINLINDIKPSESLTLKKVIEIVISHLGLSISVVDNLSPEPFNKAEDVIAPSVGENAFEFLLKYARKRQALLTSDSGGNVVITQSEPTESGAKLQRDKFSNSNNILSQSWSIGGNLLFNKYITRGQLDPRALNFTGGSTSSDVENQNGLTIDTNVRPGRQSVKVESKSYSSDQLDKRSKWSSQLAKAKSTKFSCSVKGHQKPGGGIWEINTLVLINSYVADISRKMLVNNINFVQSEGSPTITNLEFVERDVYTIDDKILSQRPAGDLNDVFKTLG